MYAYYAVPMIGATLHMVNIRYPPEILFYTIQNSEDKYIIVNSAFMPLIMQYKDLFSFVSLFIIYSENGHEKYNMDNYVFMDDLLKENDEKSMSPMKIPLQLYFIHLEQPDFQRVFIIHINS